MPNTQSSLRLLFPQWQGGNNPPYFFGSRMLSAGAACARRCRGGLCPRTGHAQLANEDGIVGRRAIVEQLLDAQDKITRNQPETIVTLGAIAVSAPFAACGKIWR